MEKLRECKHPGCHTLTNGTYCDKHRSENRDTTCKWKEWYKTRWWVHNRAAFLKAHPFCARGGKPASTVHHKIPHNGSEQLFKDMNNWESLCSSCHSKLHKEMREGS